VIYFRRPRKPTKIVTVIFVGCFGRRKYDLLTKIHLFSSGADEKEPIFVEFISSAYFHRLADENSYFRGQLAYFRRLAIFVGNWPIFVASGRQKYPISCSEITICMETGRNLRASCDLVL
jgi:hypothetical protein